MYCVYRYKKTLVAQWGLAAGFHMAGVTLTGGIVVHRDSIPKRAALVEAGGESRKLGFMPWSVQLCPPSKHSVKGN